MAIIVHQSPAVDMFDVDPDYNVGTSGTIPAGTLVGLNASGYVAKAGNNGSSGVQPLGLAGDSISDEYRTTAYSDDVVISGSGARRWTANRISDYYNETLASGKMTVYIGSGVFFTDQYVTSDTFVLGGAVYPNNAGKATVSTGTSARRVGYCLGVPTDYPSGVPGADEAADMSLSLGQFVKLQLNIG